MFTGIIQDIGTIESVEIFDESLKLSISTSLDAMHLALGASVACNGCCLTVVEHKKLELLNSDMDKRRNIFFVDIGPKTLLTTRFLNVKIGDKVNLEPALRVGDPLGGHQVSGHVDGVFQIASFEKNTNDFWKLKLLIPLVFSKYLVPKGSIAVAGISLTIANISNHSGNFKLVDVMIIPHTFHNTILQYITANFNAIEIEFDLTAKTIASMLEGMITNYTQMTT